MANAFSAMQQHYGLSASSGSADAVNGANLFNEADRVLAGSSGTGLLQFLTLF